jgi:hypothetical protein
MIIDALKRGYTKKTTKQWKMEERTASHGVGPPNTA